MFVITGVTIIGVVLIAIPWSLVYFDIHERVNPSFKRWDRLFLAHHPDYKGPKVAGK